MQSEIPDDVMETAKAVVDRMPTHAFKAECVADVAKAIMAHAALPSAEPVKPYGYVYESTVRYCDGRGPHRKVDFFYTKKNISDDDIEEFEISEAAVYDRPQHPAPSVAVKALEWNDDPCPAAKCVFGHYVVNKNYADVELLVGYGRASATGIGRITLEVGATEADLKAAAQTDYETRIRSALTAQVQDVAEGWQLVPKEPTQEMLDACGPKPKHWDATPSSRRVRESADRMSREDYKTMLAAAPANQEG